MSDSLSQILLNCGLMLGITGCASPHEHLYLVEPAQAAPDGLQARRTILLGPVNIPHEVDRPQILVRQGPHRVVISEQERWAVPLKEALPRILAAEMSRRTPDTRFAPASSSAIGTASGHLAIDVIRFDVAPDSGAYMSAHWVYRMMVENGRMKEGDAAAHVEVTDAGYEGMVEALRQSCVILADQIVTQLSGP